jgi:outer membrane protein OmpA-like peptidoglycan-associated protein
MYGLIRKWSARWALVGLLAVLAGCQTPPPPAAGLSPAQLAVLKHEGFKLTDDGWTFGVGDKLLFHSDEAVLSDKAEQFIGRLGHVLVSANITHLRIEGHTDSVGSDGYNDELSLHRAQAVTAALLRAGIPAAGVATRGLGKLDPVADNGTVAGRSENRRVAIIISP